MKDDRLLPVMWNLPCAPESILQLIKCFCIKNRCLPPWQCASLNLSVQKCVIATAMTVIATMLAMMLNKTTLKHAVTLTLIIHSQLIITFEIIIQYAVFVLSHGNLFKMIYSSS